MKQGSIYLALVLAVVSSSARVQGQAGVTNKSFAAVSAGSANADAGLHERNQRYQLRRGDSFDLEFSFSPEFNQTVVVQPDGFITLKGVGSMMVEGQTVPQLTDTIKKAYSDILHDPVLTIAPRDFEKPYFIAAGQVGRPGKYDLRSDLTITEAVSIAGGFTEKSKHSEVALYRPVPDGRFEVKVINIKKLLASHNLSEDLRLQPGDVVYVPQNRYSKIRPYIPSPSTGAGIYYTPVQY